ncbi:MAG: hypothetical protein MZV70_57750 [Desulfobacterales bacterium]|nr:hypothetical protein [Desulfobacterales bacterium]
MLANFLHAARQGHSGDAHVFPAPAESALGLGLIASLDDFYSVTRSPAGEKRALLRHL